MRSDVIDRSLCILRMGPAIGNSYMSPYAGMQPWGQQDSEIRHLSALEVPLLLLPQGLQPEEACSDPSLAHPMEAATQGW